MCQKLFLASLIGLVFNCGILLGQNEKYAKVKVFISSSSEIQLLFDKGIDIDHYHPESDNSISFFIQHSHIPILEEVGLRYHIQIADFQAFYKEQSIADQSRIEQATRHARTADNFGYGSVGGFYSLQQIEEELDKMYNLFPNLITQKYSIGTTHEGRSIWAVKISDNPRSDEDEPAVYYDALHHAREPLSMAVTINYMYWLLENYDDPEVRYIINNRELYFVPCVNPDGYEFNRILEPNGGGMWRKNKVDYGFSCLGVDLNRNYGFGFGLDTFCSKLNPCYDTYRGPNAFSERESSAVMSFMDEINPTIAFSTHSTAGNYLMPYGFDSSPPEFDIYSEWASDFAAENDYPYGVTLQMLNYTSCGTTRDYLHDRGIYAWTPEIGGSGFWPNQSKIFGLVDENVYPMFYQAWIAGGYTDIQSHTIIGDATVGGSFQMNVEVKNKGVGASSTNVKVSIESNDPNISIVGNGNIGVVAARARKSTSPFTIVVGSNFNSQQLNLTLKVTQGSAETDRQLIKIPIGSSQILFEDDAESNSSSWFAKGNGIDWGRNNDDSYGGNFSYGDSNNGNSFNYTNNYWTIINGINLSGSSKPYLEFMSKWSLASQDFTYLQITKNNGFTWSTIKTFQANESWHQELIDLTSYVNENIRIRFHMTTNGFQPGDGFYFDDISIRDYENCQNQIAGSQCITNQMVYDFDASISPWQGINAYQFGQSNTNLGGVSGDPYKSLFVKLSFDQSNQASRAGGLTNFNNVNQNWRSYQGLEFNFIFVGDNITDPSTVGRPPFRPDGTRDVYLELVDQTGKVLRHYFNDSNNVWNHKKVYWSQFVGDNCFDKSRIKSMAVYSDRNGLQYTEVFRIDNIELICECEENLVELNSPAINNDRILNNSIMSNGNVALGNQVNYKAGSELVFSDGFEVQEGARFLAEIRNCEEIENVRGNVLTLNFNNTLGGVEGESPSMQSGINYNNAILGQGVILDNQAELSYLSNSNIRFSEGTIEAVIKTNWNGNDNVNHTLFSWGQGGGILIEKDVNGYFKIIVNRYGQASAGNEIATAFSIDDWVANDWKHIAVTWSSTLIELYINGSKKNQESTNYALPPISANSFFIGSDNLNKNWNGTIDEFYISDFPKTAFEIMEFYESLQLN